jgi:hypothetical protein
VSIFRPRGALPPSAHQVRSTTVLDDDIVMERPSDADEAAAVGILAQEISFDEVLAVLGGTWAGNGVDCD